MSYKIGRNSVKYEASGGVSGKVGSRFFWNPIENSTYIGVNRAYATTRDAGSGVRKVECYTL